MQADRYRLRDTGAIVTPALIYYREIIEENILAMIRLAGGTQRLWPHVKSHKSADMVRLLLAHGIARFKCATVAEAEMAAACGAEQVILAYPLVGPNIGRFLRLKAAFPATGFFAVGDDEGQLRQLAEAARAEGTRADVLLDIDDGLHRTGVPVERAEELYRLAAALPGLGMRGLHVYDGHRHEDAPEERARGVDADVAGVYALRDRLTAAGLPCGILVMGGSPSFPCHARYPGVYVSPGTCLIQDYGYASHFPDLPFTVGAMLLTRAISHPGPGMFTVDLGYKGVAADPVPPRAVILGYEDAVTVMQNEEHWVLRMPQGAEARRPAIGTELYAAPWHICPTSALYPEILVAQAGAIVARWPVTARNRAITL
ncbi:MAG: D-TA family PLP-dependent enzyme [Clostridiales bacterium]|nr:D-TA family PLP-dependent enzyme [Clostridiales bacterium]